MTDMSREKVGAKTQKKTSVSKARPPKKQTVQALPLQPLASPSNLKIGSAYNSHILDRPAFTGSAVSRSAQPGISITVQIPALRRPKPIGAKTQQGNPSRQTLRRLAVIAPLLLLILLGSGFGYNHVHGKQTPSKAVAETPSRTQPTYQPLVPSAAQASAKSYDGQRNLVSYTTNFSDARVTVSQQPLPANFSNDPSALQRAADSLNAKQKIETDKGPLYVANSDTDNSQRAIYATKDVLIFIQADRKLDDVSWKSFVDLLQAKSWQSIN
jgi:hypothetical protein